MTPAPMPYRLKIGNRWLPNYVATLDEASAVYCAERDNANEGASTFPSGTVYRGRKPIATVSYNGKVWPLKPYSANTKPLYVPGQNG